MAQQRDLGVETNEKPQDGPELMEIPPPVTADTQA